MNAAQNLVRRRYPLFFCLLLALIGGGCSSVDVSGYHLFAQYVGPEIALQRPAVLVAPAGNPQNPGFLPRTGVAKHAMLVDDTQGRPGWVWVKPKIAAQLPAGHLVTLQSVREEITLDRQDIVAYGHTRLPGSDREVTFAYHWGQSWQLWPAPWEPGTVQAMRRFDWRRPPHFDYDMFYPHDKRPESLFSR